jgi:hypothetical protein
MLHYMRALVLGCVIALVSTPVFANALHSIEGSWEAEVFDKRSSEFSYENLCGDRSLKIQIDKTTRVLTANRKGEPEFRYTIENVGPSHVTARPQNTERDESDVGKNLWYFMLAKPDILLWFDYGRTKGKERTNLDRTWHRCQQPMS